MNVTVLKQEKGMATLKITAPGEVLTKALDEAYNVFKKNHSDFDVPRSEVTTSADCADIYRQAVQDVFSDLYNDAIAASGLTMASEPVVSVLQASETEGMEFQMEFALRPEVKLGQYKGIRVKMPNVEPTEEEYEFALAQAAQQNSVPTTVERPAQLGDIATIDFTGYLDGVPFDGGQGSDYPLTLGSGSFIPGFEEQLVGASAGEDVEVNVTFPENYHAPDLAGKATVFQCKVKQVQALELQPLTEEQEAKVRQQVQQKKENLADQQVEDEVLGRILDEAQVEIPEAMVNSEINMVMSQFVSELAQQGMDLDAFQQRTGKTTEEMLSEMRPLATRRIMLRLVLSAIAEAENLTATDEEVEAQFERMAQQYGISAAQLKLYMGEGAEEEVKAEITSSKAYTLLRECTILEMN